MPQVVGLCCHYVGLTPLAIALVVGSIRAGTSAKPR